MKSQEDIVKEVYGSVRVLKKPYPVGVSLLGVAHVNVRKMYKGIYITDCQTDLDAAAGKIDDIMILTEQLAEDLAKAGINALNEDDTQAVDIIISIQRVSKSYIGSERSRELAIAGIKNNMEEHYDMDKEMQARNALPKDKRKFKIDEAEDDPRAKNAINTEASATYDDPDDIFDEDQGKADNDLEVINPDNDDEIQGGKATITKKNNQSQHKQTHK